MKKIMIQTGFCQCGCGQKTNKVKWSDKSKGLVGGNYYRFVKGHGNSVINWPKKRISLGRLHIYRPDHHRAMSNGYVFNHILVAEKAICRPISKKVDIHHVDLDKLNDANSNLVICENRAYHGLLHQRTRALEKCGHANYLKCQYCKKYDAPENIKVSSKSKYHPSCKNKYELNRRKTKL